MVISYIPSNDELVLRFRPLAEKPTKQVGRFKLWWDDNGCIYGINISRYSEELEEFKKNLNIVRLGGIWKGIKISNLEIKEMRQELLRKLEEKW